MPSSDTRRDAPIIVWFRDDLRIADNPALNAAAATGAPILAVYCVDRHTERAHGGASRWWLHHSLAALSQDLEDRGASLTLTQGPADAVIHDLCKAVGASAVYWNRRYTGNGIERDSALKASLKDAGIAAQSFNAQLLVEPWTVQTGSGSPYRVFTPFSRAVRAMGPIAEPTSAPPSLNGYKESIESSVPLATLDLLPTKPDWAGGLRESWQPGSAGAAERLDRFIADQLAGYPDARNVPGKPATTKLSPHLRFGEISPRALWQAAEQSSAPRDAVFKFHQELLWREFSYHLLYHYPDLARANHQTKFDAFPWRDHAQGEAAEHLQAWQKGMTGYPIVDAGMRELWHTGWMHNRVRMIVGSFLVKHLLIDWRAGEDWFWDTLVDADPANNSASWQWVAGSGADAAPYFRVFNPVLQGEKFDGDGAYTRRWVPELADMPKKFLHKPWEAPNAVLSGANVRLGSSYPRPIVDHAAARQRALDAFKSLSSASDAA